MNIQERSYIESKVASEKKSGPVAYLLWFFLGSLGVHRFYLGKPATAIVMIVVTLLINWWMFFIPMAIWLIVDAFLIPGWLKKHEAEVRNRAQNELLFYQQTNTNPQSAVSVNISHNGERSSEGSAQRVIEKSNSDEATEKQIFTVPPVKDSIVDSLITPVNENVISADTSTLKSVEK
ncbi:TM2 domain-containing protein [Macrococcus equipercicus]|uniref:TM2 domain-containing protein n=1 Tax=Macrococcus equipercicus TaxID=69967 RepID=A0A9Q9BUA4_9STAP|nr:TM2 domain-containing protein [Macrococcus equipercicus]UTH14211.1 TM2 domain-containing protein [Macrococcus equipercicus]